jgi:hypothetical protein
MWMIYILLFCFAMLGRFNVKVKSVAIKNYAIKLSQGLIKHHARKPAGRGGGVGGEVVIFSRIVVSNKSH